LDQCARAAVLKHLATGPLTQARNGDWRANHEETQAAGKVWLTLRVSGELKPLLTSSILDFLGYPTASRCHRPLKYDAASMYTDHIFCRPGWLIAHLRFI
jgi:hypothetical protein